MTTTWTMTPASRRVFAVIAAAGSSSRMGGKKKEFLPLPQGGTPLSRCLAVFLKALAGHRDFPLERVVIALPAEDFARHAREAQGALAAVLEAPRPGGLVSVDFVPGGATRQESVFRSLLFLQEHAPPEFARDALVLIHDGARPGMDEALVLRVAEAAATGGAALPAVEPVDTLKERGAEGLVSRHLDRSALAAAQTPQGFWFLPLLEAHRAARQNTGRVYTDDTEIWDALVPPGVNRGVRLVEGSARNKKITYPEDMPGHPVYRTGLGNDLHPLVSGRRLVLGGVEIPAGKGEGGHSDGDALLHAVIDALLGASALGDIGSFFPPGDPAWKDADSRDLLRRAWAAVEGAGWGLENIDCVVELEEPKLLPWREAVRESLAEILGCLPERVFVKAKTGEKIGPVGRGEAVRAWAVCLLKKNEGP
jgi:2-C-methyl-D-erythritol 4-phosphate cytidylyltransferase/2-C-methyl-D-erythritol 2,4-cyclodiphosphate synthase